MKDDMNLFDDIPPDLPDELFTLLLDANGIRIMGLGMAWIVA